MTRLSVGKEDGVTHGECRQLLAAHGIDLQGGEEVVTHRKLNLSTGTNSGEVQNVTDRVGRGTHTEGVRNIRLAPIVVCDGDSHIITTSLGELVVHDIAAKRVYHLPTHVPMERAGGIGLMIAIVVVRIDAFGHQMDDIIRTDIQIEVAVILQMRHLVASRRVKLDVDTLARTHAVGGNRETCSVLLIISLETDGQAAGGVIDRRGVGEGRRCDGVGDAVRERHQQRVVNRLTIVDEQRVTTFHIERRQVEVHPHRVVVRVVGADGDVVVHVGTVVAIKASIVIDGNRASGHGGLRAHAQCDHLRLQRQHAA